MGDLMQIASVKDRPDLRWPNWTPISALGPSSAPTNSDGSPDLFAMMRTGDVLVQFPYQSFTASVERFVEQAVDDPNVLAIKMTVYRTSDDSALVPALIAAAEKGKQAVCMVELKARFDERRNIHWSRALEEAGAHVVHGIPGLKTHAKAILIVRRERGTVRHYVMIGTGNFHARNARLYEDFGLFTCDHQIGQEVANLFNTLTGYGHPEPQRKTLVAPTWLREPLLREIERTAQAYADGDHDARIVMKMNSLVDEQMIEGLYRASQTGVPIRLNIRGICCLIPGIPGVSESIEVVSVVGRFLEHARIYSFHRDGESLYYIGSADLMPRNLDHRVELLDPRPGPRAQGGDRRHARALPERRHLLLGDGRRQRLDAPHRPHPQRARRADGADARRRRAVRLGGLNLTLCRRTDGRRAAEPPGLRDRASENGDRRRDPEDATAGGSF